MYRSCSSVFILELDIFCEKIMKVFGRWMKKKAIYALTFWQFGLPTSFQLKGEIQYYTEQIL